MVGIFKNHVINKVGILVGLNHFNLNIIIDTQDIIFEKIKK